MTNTPADRLAEARARFVDIVAVAPWEELDAALDALIATARAEAEERLRQSLEQERSERLETERLRVQAEERLRVRRAEEELEAARNAYDNALHAYDEAAPGPSMSYGVVVELSDAWDELVSCARASGPLACVYCDALYPSNARTEDFQRHVESCARHPLAAALRRAEQAEERNWALVEGLAAIEARARSMRSLNTSTLHGVANIADLARALLSEQASPEAK